MDKTVEVSQAARELLAGLNNLREQFAQIASMHPNDQPHYPSGVRPFGTGDLRHVIETLDQAIAALATQPAAPSTGDVGEAIRKAKIEADKTYGIAWANLEEISRVELILAALNTRATQPEAALREALVYTPVLPVADDLPDWLTEKVDVPRYLERRADEIQSAVRLVSIAGGNGGTAQDWIEQAASYLWNIGTNAPPYGSLHHALIIISEQLVQARAALKDHRHG